MEDFSDSCRVPWTLDEVMSVVESITEEEQHNVQAVTSNTNTAGPSDSFLNFLESPLPQPDVNDICDYLHSIERNTAPNTENLYGSYPSATSDIPEYPNKDIYHTPMPKSPDEISLLAQVPAETFHHAPVAAEDPLSMPVPAETFYHAPVVAEDPLSMPVPAETFHHAPVAPEYPLSMPMPAEAFHHAPVAVEDPLSMPVPAETFHHASVVAEVPLSMPVPAETFHHPPVAVEVPLSMPVPAETFLPAREPPVSSLPAPAVMNAVQRLCQLSAPAYPQVMMHEPPVTVPSPNVPTTSITTMKTSCRANISRSSGRCTAKKPPGVPSFASLCYSAISHSSTGTLYLNEIYTWVQSNYTNFDPADTKWKNSIRNILKRNPGFRKANRNSRYGYQYSIHPACAGAFLLGQFKITHAEALIAAYNDQNKNSCSSESTQHQPTPPAARQNYGHQPYSSTQYQSHQHARSHRYQPYVTTQQQRFQNTRYI